MSSLQQITNGKSRADSARPRRGRSGRMAQALGGLLVLGLVSLSAGCQDATPVAAAPEAPEVQVTPVLQKISPSTTSGRHHDGYVTAQMRARVTGYLMSQEYTEGAFVKTGDLLFGSTPARTRPPSMRPRATTPWRRPRSKAKAGQLAQAQAQVEQGKAQIAQSQADVTQAQANQRRTQLDVDKYAPLAQDGSVSQQEFDTAAQNNLANQAAVVSARANVEAARATSSACKRPSSRRRLDIARAQANVQAMKAALDNARLNLGWTRVTSPIDGLAGLRSINIGDVVTKDQTVLTTVSTLDPIYVEFQLSETEYLRYHTAAAGTFRRVEDIRSSSSSRTARSTPSLGGSMPWTSTSAPRRNPPRPERVPESRGVACVGVCQSARRRQPADRRAHSCPSGPCRTCRGVSRWAWSGRTTPSRSARSRSGPGWVPSGSSPRDSSPASGSSSPVSRTCARVPW